MFNPIILLVSFLCYVDGHLFGIGLKRICLCRCGMVQNRVYPYQFPWHVVVNTGTDLVGGTLISDRHVLTVASALFGVPSAKVSVTLGTYDRCGENHGLNSSVALVSINPGYNHITLAGNLALIKLRYPVVFNEFITPVCLPYLGLQEYGHVGFSPSWGLDSDTSSCIPRVAVTPVFPGSSCAGSVDSVLLTPDKGCFDPLGAHNAIKEMDLGAPVLRRWSVNFPFRLIGVVSSPITILNTTSLYTKVADYLSWIYDNIRFDCNCV